MIITIIIIFYVVTLENSKNWLWFSIQCVRGMPFVIRTDCYLLPSYVFAVGRRVFTNTLSIWVRSTPHQALFIHLIRSIR